MSDLIRKTVWTGLGLAYLTYQRILEATKKAAEERKTFQEAGKALIDNLQKEIQEAREKAQAQVDETVKEHLERLNVPTREDIKKLEESLKKLEKAMKAK
ncbi:MAG: phasin family protein [Candidatus Cloacimonadia bacterium]